MKVTVQPGTDDKALVPLRVLIADDHEANRVLAGKILEKRGHTSTYAENGRQAIDHLQRSSFDLILMDVQMPELDGLQATAVIRTAEEAKGTHIPIVALTAHAMKGDREKCLAAGMDAYLSKPLRARELIALVEKLCELVTAGRIGTAASRSDAEPWFGSPEDSSPDPKNREDRSVQPIDFGGALDRMDGDTDLLIEQMRFFLADAPQLLTSIAGAIESHDGAQLQSSAHRLKGLVSSYDETKTAEACLQLEFAGRDNAFGGAADTLALATSRVQKLLGAVRDFVTEQTQT